jgi:hypothetical protein
VPSGVWKTSFAIALACVTSGIARAQSDRHEWNLQLDVTSSVARTDVPSWLAGSVGKLRYDEGHDGIGVGRALFEYRGRIAPTWFTHVVGDIVTDGGRGLDLTEAYFEWRPVPRSATRQRLKVGAFFPPLSLENRETGWTSPFSISSSAINTWLGEELRTVGAEWSLTRHLGSAVSAMQVEVFAAAFLGNDPAGTLLAWKGWSLHDRQTRLNDVLPLPPLPQIGPGAMFDRQALQAEPFIETDDRPGYYIGAEWRVNRRVSLAAAHYDNHADPLSVREGQYGWTTRFDHLGAQIELPADVGLIAQWMDGTTVMGPFAGPARVVDTAFDSHFVLLTKRFGRQRVSVRLDGFAVVDRDSTPLDANGEDGRALTLAYAFTHSKRLVTKVEWLRVETARPSWTYLGLPGRDTERSLQVQVSLRLAPEF